MAFLTVNTLFITSIVLVIIMGMLGIYVRRVNARLTSSINLINDLYKLNQTQATTINDLLGDTNTPSAVTSASSSSSSSLVDSIVEKASQKLKATLADDIEEITEQLMSTFVGKEIQPAVELVGRILTLENKIELLQNDDPEFKMYSRASQLVKEGTSIEDVMEATQLPRAEIEVIVGLQRPKKSLS